MQTTNRGKIIVIPSAYILDVFSGGILSGDFIRVYEAVGLPKTATPKNVFVSYERNAVCMVVTDPSFDEVPIGCEFPIVNLEWQTVVQKVKSRKPIRNKL